MRRVLLLAALLPLLAGCAGPPRQTDIPAESLEIYFIDVEGGQATLLVSPTGESLLVDTGWPGFEGRDADRIAAAAGAAGVTTIDQLVITHYHDDHVGGMHALVERIPVRRVITHGPNGETGRMAEAVAPIYAAAMEAIGGQPRIVGPGDVIPIAGLDIQVLASNRQLIPSALPGAGASNPLCEGAPEPQRNTSENSASVAVLITFGAFRFLNLGDLTQDLETVLACPVNRIGEVDLYLTTHHGSGQSNAAVLVHALRPRVAIMNNGARKGGDPAVLRTVRSAPGLQDLWMLHRSEAGGAEGNVAEPYIANLSDTATATGHDSGYGMRVSAHRDGSFTVTNERNGHTHSYPARP